MNFSGSTDSLDKVLASLGAAAEEDVEEETNHMWFTPLVRKKVKQKDASWKTTTGFHDHDKDFTSVGLRGRPPATLGWCDWGIPGEDESVAFKHRQNLLCKHYAWFHKIHHGRWLRS